MELYYQGNGGNLFSGAGWIVLPGIGGILLSWIDGIIFFCHVNFIVIFKII